jgi:hypothetical protein
MERPLGVRLRLLIFIFLAVFLVGEVATRSIAAYFAETRPELAVRLRSTEPTALLNLAETTLDLELTADKVESSSASSPSEVSSGTRQDIQSPRNIDLAGPSSAPPTQGGLPRPTRADSRDGQIRFWAELALCNDPLNARAFRILGQLSQRVLDGKRTDILMQAAVHRSLLESVAVNWMMYRSYQDQKYHAAIVYADTLLRLATRQGVQGGGAIWMLGKLAETPNASGELTQLLATNPNWRPAFFSSLASNAVDARTPLAIFLNLKDTPAPAATAELGPYLKFLIERGNYELAYYAWLQFLPADQLSKAGNVFNGSFEFVPSGMPFDWEFTKAPGVAIATGLGQDEGRGLFIQFGPGRVNSPVIATQLILLAPGNYQFQGRYRSEIVNEQGLHWHITCAGGSGAEIGASPRVTGTQLEWKDFSFSFTVPDANCLAQDVGLVFGARRPSEQFISGSIRYDDLKIVRESVVSPPL